MEPIAIVGLSFRLPRDVDNEASLWDMLEHGRNAMTEWPKERSNIDAFCPTAASPDKPVRLPKASDLFMTDALSSLPEVHTF
jgi:acyl transferase domain-containing protein